jgi:anti-anti-sigma factor
LLKAFLGGHVSAEFKLVKEIPEGKPDVAVFHLGGWLDAMSEQKLVDAVQQAKDAGAKYVLIDMRDLDTVTSAGIRAMHRAYQMLTPRDEAPKVGRLKLCNAPAQIYQVLSTVGLLSNVPMYESADDAIDSFGQ